MSKLSVVSYNVNGVRSAVSKGLLDWLSNNQPDVVCLQEIKIAADDFDEAPFKKIGYHSYLFPAVKKGYSGVAVLSKQKPDKVVKGIDIERYDNEGRNIRIDLGELSVMSAYFPSGTTGDERQVVKMDYLDDFYNYIVGLKNTRSKLLVCGDFNICHKPIDIHNPVANKDASGFKPEEREWMEKLFSSGFIDTFRQFNKQPDEYSWWSFRANSRANNKGWRIDYIAATEGLRNSLVSSKMHQDAKHSDHCPVSCVVNL